MIQNWLLGFTSPGSAWVHPVSPPLARLLALRLAPTLYCNLETLRVLWLNLWMDVAIAVSYAVIVGSLLWIAARLRRHTEFRRYLWILLSFALFIVACGGTHLMDVVNLWWPHVRLSSGIRIACAIASVATAAMLSFSAAALARTLGGYFEVLQSARQQRDDAKGALSLSDAIAKERTEAAAELAEANRRLKTVMDSTSDGIYHVNRDWQLLYGNRKVVETLPDFAPGADFWTCFPAMREAGNGERLRDCMRLRTEQRFENFYEPYKRWFRVQVFPTDEGISVFYQDVTVEKDLERSLARERELREWHIRSLSHVAGGLAHEISNPLTIIHARASDLDEAMRRAIPPGPAQIQAATTSIVRTADRAIRILRGLKGLSREGGKDPMEFADLSSICHECFEILGTRFERHQIELRVDLALDLPRMFCREVQIAQVITNLLNNGVDAIVQGCSAERWISVETVLLDEGVQIRIGDSGPGIDPSIRGRLMEPFFTTKQPGLGTGVGLSLARAIIADHGGSFQLLDKLPYTCFQIVLPVAPRAVESLAEEPVCHEA